MTEYNTDHLTIDELKAVCMSVHNQIMNPDSCGDDLLAAPMEELQDEYLFWSSELEKRIATETQDSTATCG